MTPPNTHAARTCHVTPPRCVLVLHVAVPQNDAEYHGKEPQDRLQHRLIATSRAGEEVQNSGGTRRRWQSRWEERIETRPDTEFFRRRTQPLQPEN